MLDSTLKSSTKESPSESSPKQNTNDSQHKNKTSLLEAVQSSDSESNLEDPSALYL